MFEPLRPTVIAAALLFLLPSTGSGAPPIIPPTAIANVEERIEAGYTPGLIIGMINSDGRTVMSFGRKSWADDSPPDEHSLYEIASVSKTFTGVLLAEMVQRGEVSLSDKVSTLLPGVTLPRGGGSEITLRHLATHRSGLPYQPPNLIDEGTDLANPFAGYDREKLYDFLASHVMERLPGAAWEYSNTGMALLGHALAVKKETTWETLLRERVLDPIGLDDTAVTLDASQLARRLPGHHGVVQRPPFESDILAPAAGLFSTVDDLLTYLERNAGLRRTPAPLGPALAESHRFHAASDTSAFSLGLGWWLWDEGIVAQHGGDSMGQTVAIAFNKNTRTGVVVLTNNRSNIYTSVHELAFHCLEQSWPLPTIRQPANVSESILRRYVGRYSGTFFEMAYFYDITLQHGRLVVRENIENVPYTVFPTGIQDFELMEPELDTDYTFVMDPDTGKASTLEWTMPGFDLSGTATRTRRPPRIRIARDGPDVQVTLRGEGDQSYFIESRDPLTGHWTTLSTRTIWDGPYREPLQGGPRLFRARAKE